MFFKNKKAEVVAWSLVAIVAVVAVVGIVLMNVSKPATVSITGAAASGQGACVIIPNINAPVETLGQGLMNADSVCDAAANGCEYCIGYCSVFRKTVDKYGCGASCFDPNAYAGQGPEAFEAACSEATGGCFECNVHSNPYCEMCAEMGDERMCQECNEDLERYCSNICPPACIPSLEICDNGIDEDCDGEDGSIRDLENDGCLGGLIITDDLTLTAGKTYYLDRGIVIWNSGIVLDGNGATIVGTGHGVSVTEGSNDVTIKNLNIQGYYKGITIGLYTLRSRILNNTLTGIRDIGIYTIGEHALVAGNTVTDSYIGVMIAKHTNQFANNTFCNNDYVDVHCSSEDFTTLIDLGGNSCTTQSRCSTLMSCSTCP